MLSFGSVPVQHDELDEAIDEIELIIRRSQQDLLRAKLVELGALLEDHFAHEQQSPMYTTLPLEHPQIAATIEQLLIEHDEMLIEVRRFGPLFEASSWEEITARAMELIKKLDAHEKIEIDLLQNLYARDFGPLD